MDNLISRKALLAEYDRQHEGEAGRARKLIEDAPFVHAISTNTIERLLNSECARLYRADEKMLERMGGYNPSAFMAGYQYALDCIIGKFTQIKGERKENG